MIGLIVIYFLLLLSDNRDKASSSELISKKELLNIEKSKKSKRSEMYEEELDYSNDTDSFDGKTELKSNKKNKRPRIGQIRPDEGKSSCASVCNLNLPVHSVNCLLPQISDFSEKSSEKEEMRNFGKSKKNSDKSNSRKQETYEVDSDEMSDTDDDVEDCTSGEDTEEGDQEPGASAVFGPEKRVQSFSDGLQSFYKTVTRRLTSRRGRKPNSSKKTLGTISTKFANKFLDKFMDEAATEAEVTSILHGSQLANTEDIMRRERYQHEQCRLREALKKRRSIF